MEEWQYHDWKFNTVELKHPEKFWQIDCSDIQNVYVFGEMSIMTTYGSYKIPSDIIIEMLQQSGKILLGTKKITRRHIVDVREKENSEHPTEGLNHMVGRVFEDDDFNEQESLS